MGIDINGPIFVPEGQMAPQAPYKQQVFVGGRKSGKTLRAILWMLQNWERGATIVEPDESRAKHVRMTCASLTGKPPSLFSGRVVSVSRLKKSDLAFLNRPMLLDDKCDFRPYDLGEIDMRFKVEAYTDTDNTAPLPVVLKQ